MTSNEIDDKKRLYEIASSVRKKYDAIRRKDVDFNAQLARKYEPLFTFQKEKAKDVKSISLIDQQVCNDPVFGLKRTKYGQYLLGEYPVKFLDEKIYVSNRVYRQTYGLLSLLTQKIPENYSPVDLKNYKQMLVDTKAHLVKNSSKIKLKGGVKRPFIVKLFPTESPVPESPLASTPMSSSSKIFEMNLSDSALDSTIKSTDEGDDEENEEEEQGENVSITGKGIDIGEQMKVIKDEDEVKNLYTYWDDPNELVDRLCLLHASRKAGNNNLSNEILNIESELREAGYIY